MVSVGKMDQTQTRVAISSPTFQALDLVARFEYPRKKNWDLFMDKLSIISCRKGDDILDETGSKSIERLWSG